MQQEKIIQKKMAQASLQLLEVKYSNERLNNQHLDNLFARLQLELDFFKQDLQEPAHPTGNALGSFQHIYLELLEQQRLLLHDMNHRAEFDEELIRKYLSLIDLEELKVREKLLQE